MTSKTGASPLARHPSLSCSKSSRTQLVPNRSMHVDVITHFRRLAIHSRQQAADRAADSLALTAAVANGMQEVNPSVHSRHAVPVRRVAETSEAARGARQCGADGIEANATWRECATALTAVLEFIGKVSCRSTDGWTNARAVRSGPKYTRSSTIGSRKCRSAGSSGA